MRLGVLWAAILTGLIAWAVLAPGDFINAILFLSGAIVLGIALIRMVTCLLPFRRQETANFSLPDWPHYTVLVPLYREAHMVKALAAQMRALDYPKDRLDIIFITEADDLPTTRAARAIAGGPMRVHAVPPSLPRTKPKAMNHALRHSPPRPAGGLLTIYDAEDRPHPQQLRRAAARFAADPDLAAVQAPLRIYNARSSWLAALFALEYAALFYVWNPGLARLGLPFPLGGTSNHIRVRTLIAAGGWDAHNVTEDADLAFRIAALDRPGARAKIGCIDLATEEEAVTIHKDWVHQRARWQKGFLQTLGVHLRRKPCAPDGGPWPRKARLKNLLSLNITLAATLLAAFLHVPSVVIILCAWAANGLGWIEVDLTLPAIAIFASGYGAALILAAIGAIRARQPILLWFVPLMPFYWLLYYWPALIAAYEYVVMPSHWRKTDHVGPDAKAAKPVETAGEIAYGQAAE